MICNYVDFVFGKFFENEFVGSRWIVTVNRKSVDEKHHQANIKSYISSRLFSQLQNSWNLTMFSIHMLPLVFCKDSIWFAIYGHWSHANCLGNNPWKPFEQALWRLPSIKGTLRLFGTLAYSPYPPELDKSIHTFFHLSACCNSVYNPPLA